jgi:acyl dehydratase
MDTTTTRFWSDMQPGETFATEGITISRKDILEFAAEFDPQPYHLDPDAADASIFGGLCASGWHVTAVMMRTLTDEFLARHIELLGSSGVSSLRWKKPVFAGDTLSSDIAVTGKSPSPSDERYGYLECEVNVKNQDGDPVILLSTSLLIGTGAGAARG